MPPRTRPPPLRSRQAAPARTNASHRRGLPLGRRSWARRRVDDLLAWNDKAPAFAAVTTPAPRPRTRLRATTTRALARQLLHLGEALLGALAQPAITSTRRGFLLHDDFVRPARRHAPPRACPLPRPVHPDEAAQAWQSVMRGRSGSSGETRAHPSRTGAGGAPLPQREIPDCRAPRPGQGDDESDQGIMYPGINPQHPGHRNPVSALLRAYSASSRGLEDGHGDAHEALTAMNQAPRDTVASASSGLLRRQHLGDGRADEEADRSWRPESRWTGPGPTRGDQRLRLLRGPALQQHQRPRPASGRTALRSAQHVQRAHPFISIFDTPAHTIEEGAGSPRCPIRPALGPAGRRRAPPRRPPPPRRRARR